MFDELDINQHYANDCLIDFGMSSIKNKCI
jgi:hypothetical protein